MEKILDQKDIDSLFAQQGEIGVGDAPIAAIVPYGFGRTGQISNDQMRAITQVNDQLARNLTHTLGAWLRSQVHVMLAANEQMTFAEMLSCVSEPSYVIVLRLEPLGGVGLLELNLGLALMMVDMLLGGRGSVMPVRELTDIEDSILLSVVELVVRELNSAWESAGLQFTLDKREGREQLARLMPSEERTLCISFDAAMDGVHGMLNLCLPAVVLNAMHRRLMSVRDRPRQRFESSSARVSELMAESRFTAVLRLPPMQVPTREIHALVVGSVLELPMPCSTRAELLLGGVKICSAVPVGRGDHRAALCQVVDERVVAERALTASSEEKAA